MKATELFLKRSKLAVVAAAVGVALASGAQQPQDTPRENANRQQQTDQTRENANRPQQADRSSQIARSDAGMQTLEQYLDNKPLRVSQLVGMEVQNRSGDNLGEVHEVLRGAGAGQDMRLVLQTGGVGSEEKLIAVPFDEIQINADGDEIFTNQTREQLAAAPAVMLDQRNTRTTTAPGADRDAGGASRSTQPAPGAAGQRAGGAATSANEQRIADLVGAEVVGTGDDQVGEIDDIVISTAGADSLRAVLQVGGIAGVGEKRVALPLSQLNVDRTGGEPTVRVAMDTDALERLPEFEYEEDNEIL